MKQMDVPFPVIMLADVFQLKLFFDTEEGVQGGRVITLKLDGVDVAMTPHLECDGVDAHYASAFVRINKGMWFYAVACTKMQNAPVHLFLFNGNDAGIKNYGGQEFSAGTVVGTLQKLKPYIKATFKTDNTKWELVHDFNEAIFAGLGKGKPNQSAEGAGAGN